VLNKFDPQLFICCKVVFSFCLGVFSSSQLECIVDIGGDKYLAQNSLNVVTLEEES